MRMRSKDRQVAFGDFQTPIGLARKVAAFVVGIDQDTKVVVEPTCGLGSFIRATAEQLGESTEYWGFDINEEYVEKSRSILDLFPSLRITIEQNDFYQVNWNDFFANMDEPILVIGNPPWVTNAVMGSIGSDNLPEKNNFQGYRGFAAQTGKANFDISEWMLIRLLESLQGKRAIIAVLCKTATARKFLQHAWLHGFDAGVPSLHIIDAKSEFGVSVDACLLYIHIGGDVDGNTATIYSGLGFDTPTQTFGLASGELVSNIDDYHELQGLEGQQYRRWRSGVKHDAAKIMELRKDGDLYVNGLGEVVDLEDYYIYPLLKSSDLANGRLKPDRYVLLTQRNVTDDTELIITHAPKTWQYLIDHGDVLDKRKSSIYKNRARFSVFGLGDYTFASAKVAISGFYKNIQFQALGSFDGKPIVVDDTCYFIPCGSMKEAEYFADLLNSEVSQRFIKSLIFTDAKRPITIDVLKRIDLKKLAEYIGEANMADLYLSYSIEDSQKLMVFEDSDKSHKKKK